MNEFIERLKQAQKVVFFTGAGISTDSGVPDFRSPGGIWTKYKPVYFDDFVSDSESRRQYWKMKSETHELYKSVHPNPNHDFVASFEAKNSLLGVITQNVDGLHTISGIKNQKLIELHGTDRLVTCLKCHKEYEAHAIFESLNESFDPPQCDDCDYWLKPATISFGQSMPQDKMRNAYDWCKECDVFIVMGSSLQVHPAAELPVKAKSNGAYLAILNRDPTPLDSYADFVCHDELKNVVESLK